MNIPKDMKLVRDSTRTRLPAESAAMAVNWLVRKDGARTLKMEWTSGLKGEPGQEWVQCSAPWETGHYRFAFSVKGGMVQELLLLVTPKGSEFCFEEDEGSPFSEVKVQDRSQLTELLLSPHGKDRGVELVPCWLLVTDGSRPYLANLYYDPEQAQEAFANQKVHWEKYADQRKAQEKVDEGAKEKAKHQTTVAFKAKGKGITKQKKK